MSAESSDPLAAVLEELLDLHDEVELEGRTIRLQSVFTGDPGFAVLRALGVAQGEPPVGAAAHGPNGVAIGVWRPPFLYLARWTKNPRWVVGYRFTGGSKPTDFIRSEGRIPTRLEIGNWYAAVPDDVVEAFMEVDLDLDGPPFPPPPLPPPPEPKARPRPRTAPVSPRGAAAPRPPAPRKPPDPRPEPAPTSRVCPSCNMRRSLTQFEPGSDLCVDCR